MTLRPIQEELAKLLKMGLLKTRQDGNRLYFRANTQHPFYPDVRGLVEKSTGVRALLREALTDSEVQIAFIFGSIATGKERPESDVDLLVIGDLGLRKLTKLLGGISDRVGREVNPHVLSADEFRRKIQKRDHFMTNVMESRKIFVVGDEDELERLGKKRLVEGA